MPQLAPLGLLVAGLPTVGLTDFNRRDRNHLCFKVAKMIAQEFQ
jgi:hypothetical protein